MNTDTVEVWDDQKKGAPRFRVRDDTQASGYIELIELGPEITIQLTAAEANDLGLALTKVASKPLQREREAQKEAVRQHDLQRAVRGY